MGDKIPKGIPKLGHYRNPGLRSLKISLARKGTPSFPKGYEFIPPTANEVVQLYKEGLTKREIAEKLNCSRGVVHQRLSNSDIKLRNRSEEFSLSFRRKYISDYEMGFIEGLYVWGYSGVEIPQIVKILLGRDIYNIYGILSKAGLRRDTPSEAAKKWHRKYPEKWEQLQKKRQFTLGIHPITAPERKLITILEEVIPNEFMYVGGDRIIQIGNLYPDFFNINGRKQVIEVFGDYWHRGENPQDKISQYKSFGFDCLVIWESDLSNKQIVIGKIKEFCSV